MFSLPKGGIIFASFLFAFSIAAGYWASSHLELVGNGFLEDLKRAFEPFMRLSPLELVLLILANNAVKALAVIVLGFTLGVAPLLFVAGNGFVIGFVAYEALRLKGLLYAIASLAPHGVLEVPAILLASGLGFDVGFEAWKKLLKRESQLGEKVKLGLKTYAGVVLPVLALAAVVEVFVTPVVVSFALLLSR